MCLESLKMSSLEEKVKKSIFGRYSKVIDGYIADSLRYGGSENFCIPVIQGIVNRSPRLASELLALYDRKFPVGSNSDICDDIKILQASVLDGLVVGINVDKPNDFQVYTANIGAIFGVDYESKFNIDKALELNRRGVVHAVRVDVEYTSEEGFNYKIVSLNKNTCLRIAGVGFSDGKYYLVPYGVIQRSMVFFKEMLDDKRILEVKQEKGGLIKSRYISCNEGVLARYCDSKEFVKSLKPSYFPLKGFFYAPVLGASSLSVGCTRVDLLDVFSVRGVTSVKGVKACEGGIDAFIKESCIIGELNRLYNDDLDGYKALLGKLPNRSNNLNVDSVPVPAVIIKYYHGLSEADRNKVDSLFDGLDRSVASKKEVFTRCDECDPRGYNIGAIKEALNGGIYKFHIRKKDCTYSVVTVTNNRDILKKLYGYDYFAKYESFGVRVSRLAYYLGECKRSVYSVGDWLRECGFEDSLAVNKKVNMLADEYSGDALRDALVDFLGDGNRKERTRSSNDNVVLGRVCLASLSSKGASDFYRSIDLSKVVSMYRIG